MKKRIALALVIGMVWIMTGCGNTQQSQPEADTQTGISESTEEAGNADSTENTDDESGVIDTDPAEGDTGGENGAEQADTSDGTTGEILLADFKTRISENADLTPQELADGILTNSIIEFSTATSVAEGNTLSGFSADIKGYEDGVMFGPMIGSIPFIGYIFTVPEDGDVDAFVETLQTNADPRWNICVEADETVVEAVGNTVFFLMCPRSLEE